MYARLMQASVDLEPELTCVDGSGKANGLGPLKGSENAFLLHANVVISRRLVTMATTFVNYSDLITDISGMQLEIVMYAETAYLFGIFSLLNYEPTAKISLRWFIGSLLSV